MDIKDVSKPLNANERYLHAMVVRLDALCNMVSSLLEYIAKQEGIAVDNVVEETKIIPRKKKVSK